MHYTGMAAMLMTPSMIYISWIFGNSDNKCDTHG
ncbi:hypothetical protein [Aeromonas caviae]|nr:hypothetical protein DN613_08435 [Aeromonas caviae]